MISAKRRVLQSAVLALAVAGIALWSWGYMSGQREAADRAGADLARCRAMAQQISQLRGTAAIAESREMAADELTQVIENASRGAGMPAESLVRITPEPARRVGESTMKEAPTQVVFQQVTLRQVIEFLHTLSTGKPPLQVRSIRLSTPPEDSASERWAVEISLAHLVYSPAVGSEGR